MTPEEAQAQTEERWGRKIRAPYAAFTECGWCRFMDEDAPYAAGCDECPVRKVFGTSCARVIEYRNYMRAAKDDEGEGVLRERARAVYDLAVANRRELIEAGHKLLEELGP